MRELIFALAIVGLGASFAMGATMYIEGPNERGEGPVPAATSTNYDELGLFFVDIYAEDMPSFGGFQTELEFLDNALTDFGGAGIFVAYNNFQPQAGAPWGDRQITWNEEFLPVIDEVTNVWMYGLMSNEREWLPAPDFKWSDYHINKPITEKTWLMTVGYKFLPGLEGDGSQTYNIMGDATETVFGDENANSIEFTIVGGSVTIGEGVVPEPCTLALLGIGVAGLAGYGRKRARPKRKPVAR
jgi:hypothetical protein